MALHDLLQESSLTAETAPESLPPPPVLLLPYRHLPQRERIRAQRDRPGPHVPGSSSERISTRISCPSVTCTESSSQSCPPIPRVSVETLQTSSCVASILLRHTFSLFVNTHCKDTPGWEALVLVRPGMAVVFVLGWVTKGKEFQTQFWCLTARSSLR
jgi:hypothetical protein